MPGPTFLAVARPLRCRGAEGTCLCVVLTCHCPRRAILFQYKTCKDGSVLGVTVTRIALLTHCQALTQACGYTEGMGGAWLQTSACDVR